MSQQWEQVEIEGRAFIPFDWKDTTPGGKNLGVAEFHVCVKFSRGKVSEFWVYPTQTHLKTSWHYKGGDINFSISAYEGLKSEGAWLVHWCKEHKCQSISVYSPSEAKYLEIDYHGLSFWRTNVDGKAA
jgi:hypothetical protein